MVPQQPVDPREPALGLQWSGVLARLCFVAGQLAVLYSGSRQLIGLFAMLYLLFLIISYIVGTVWVRRCWANAELLNPGGQPFGRGWATAGWAVPGLNIWMRWRIALGLWRSSGVSRAPLLVHLWWGLDLGSGAAGLSAGFPGLHSAGVLVSAALGLVHSVLFVVVIRRITTRQFESLDVPSTGLATTI